mmetsp:Transcript_75628/g.119875  ORF Transcript_75628/g.119875 Transcript_75628/m.119875 type:complete len:243 (-) Transcript_75628:198-926(-)
MEFHAAPVVLRAAPVLLGIRPALHPIGEASVAIIDSPMCVSHSFGKDMTVEVVAAMPGARASQVPMVAAPGLLVCRPSEEPIGVAFMAVIVEFMMRVLIDDFRRQVDITVLVDDVGWGRHRHRHIVIDRRVEHWHLNHLVDDLLFFRAASALKRAAFFLVPFSPKSFPVVVAIVAIEHVRGTNGGRMGPKIPHKDAKWQQQQGSCDPQTPRTATVSRVRFHHLPLVGPLSCSHPLHRSILGP